MSLLALSSTALHRWFAEQLTRSALSQNSILWLRALLDNFTPRRDAAARLKLGSYEPKHWEAQRKPIADGRSEPGASKENEAPP